MRILATILSFLLFIGCESSGFDPHNVVNATHIPVDPFSHTVEGWAEKMKDYFNYETVLATYEYEGYYFAVFMEGNVLHNLSVSKDKHGSIRTIPNTKFLNRSGTFINDTKKTAEYLQNENQKQGRFYTYDGKYIFRRDSMVLNDGFSEEECFVEIQILETPKYKPTRAEPFRSKFTLK